MFLLLLVVSVIDAQQFGYKDLTEATVYFTYEPLTTLPPKEGCLPYYPFKDPSRLCVKCNVTGNFSTHFTFRNIGNYSSSVTLATPPTNVKHIDKYLAKSFNIPNGYSLGQLNKYTFTNMNDGVYILSNFIPMNNNPWPKATSLNIALGFELFVGV